MYSQRSEFDIFNIKFDTSFSSKEKIMYQKIYKILIDNGSNLETKSQANYNLECGIELELGSPPPHRGCRRVCLIQGRGKDHPDSAIVWLKE
jgi:hypothetical protein